MKRDDDQAVVDKLVADNRPKATSKRALCAAKHHHLWTIKNERGHDKVHCARCNQCLSVRDMLIEYVKNRGEEMMP